MPEEEACGSCNDCEKACRPSRLNDSISALPKLTMLGVDPNAFTLASLEKAIHRLHLQERPGIDVHLVLGAAGDKAGEVMLNEFCGKNGNEVCAVQEGGENSGGIRVPMFTIDGLGAASKRVKDVLRSRQGPIDILHIDTEGYDPKVNERTCFKPICSYRLFIQHFTSFSGSQGGLGNAKKRRHPHAQLRVPLGGLVERAFSKGCCSVPRRRWIRLLVPGPAPSVPYHWMLRPAVGNEDLEQRGVRQPS